MAGILALLCGPLHLTPCMIILCLCGTGPRHTSTRKYEAIRALVELPHMCRYYSVNYATIQLAPMLATALFPNMLVGRLYDREAARQNPGVHSHNLSCSGGVCFRLAFFVIFALTLLVRCPSTLPPCCSVVHSSSFSSGLSCEGSIR
jgi:hypothetical protein